MLSEFPLWANLLEKAQTKGKFLFSFTQIHRERVTLTMLSLTSSLTSKTLMDTLGMLQQANTMTIVMRIVATPWSLLGLDCLDLRLRLLLLE